MNVFDQFIKHALKVKKYVRYTDDFIIVSRDREYLLNSIAPIKTYLHTQLQLDLHPKKVELLKYHQGVDFLGYVVLPTHRKVRTKTKRRMFGKLNKRIEQYKKGEIKEESLFESLNSYMGVLSHADAFETGEEMSNAFWFRLRE